MLKKSQKFYLVIKRCVDIFGSVIGLIVLSIPLLITAIITKLTSKGPVLFKQERVGKNEVPFKLYKFRSMKVGTAEIAPENLTEEEQKDMTTKWGRFMRKTSLDEFPQLFNILGGSMSFVGPRPCTDKETELIEARKSAEISPYLIKPGLSGYAQIYLRRNHDHDKKAEYDSYYVKHLSLWLDIKIFFMSFLVMFGLYKGR